MNRIFLSLIFLLLLPGFVNSEPVGISGTVRNGKGLTIRLMTYSDQLSYLRETLNSAQIGEDEKFFLTAEIDQVRYCWLDIDFQPVELFIQPSQSYEIEIQLIEGQLSTSYYDRGGLPFKIIKDDIDQLNISIQEFNQLYNDFLLDNNLKPGSGSSKTAYETFVRAIEFRFQNAKNRYLLDYTRYKTASMQMFLRLKSRENLGLEYIAGNPVLYENLEYIDFFHLYFDKYFLSYGKYFNYNKTYDLINESATLPAILDSMAVDPALEDLQVREMLLLEGLKELYYAPGFKRSRILFLVKEVEMNSIFAENQRLAKNLQTRFNHLQPGSPAPFFELTDLQSGKPYQLKDFSGKLLYLAFIDSGLPASQSELGLVSEFYNDYKDRVAFVAVSVDKNLEALKDYIRKSGSPWQFLLYGGNIDLLEQYDASTFPHFVLIDDKGLIRRCPSPSPSENIRKVFDAN